MTEKFCLRYKKREKMFGYGCRNLKAKENKVALNISDLKIALLTPMQYSLHPLAPLFPSRSVPLLRNDAKDDLTAQ